MAVIPKPEAVTSIERDRGVGTLPWEEAVGAAEETVLAGWLAALLGMLKSPRTGRSLDMLAWRDRAPGRPVSGLIMSDTTLALLSLCPALVKASCGRMGVMAAADMAPILGVLGRLAGLWSRI
jgi:hypothetical protein